MNKLTPLQQELSAFLLKKKVTPYFYPYTKGSKVIEFVVMGVKQRSVMVKLLGGTFVSNRHKLTFRSTQQGGYICSFQPLDSKNTEV